MQTTLNYREQVREIDRMLSDLTENLEGKEREVLKEAGKIMKKNVELFLDQSDIERRYKKTDPSNHDKSKPYTHMKKDVKAKIKKNKERKLYLSVGGGKKTGHKWHTVNSGTVNMRGTNFIDKAVMKSEREIDTLINNMISGVLNQS